MTTTNYFTCTLGQAAELGQELDYNNVNHFIDVQAEKVPDLPAVGFIQPASSESTPWSRSVFNFRDIQTGSQAVAKLLQTLIPAGVARGRTVALLCASTADFLFTWLALIRLGCPVLLIAPQCSPSAIAQLCKGCEVSLLFYDEIYEDIARSSAKCCEDEKISELVIKAVPFLGDSFTSSTSQNRSQTVNLRHRTNGNIASVPCPSGMTTESLEPAPTSVAYLHHTSGTSSGVPKPIPQSHHAAVGVLPHLEGSKHATLTTTPLFHGGIADLFRAWTSDALIWLFPGKGIPITARNVVKCLDVAEDCATRGETPPVRYFSSVPYVLQMLASDRQGLQKLQGMDIVGVGGAALPAEVGDELVRNEVNLVSRFGSAECGFLMSSHRDFMKDRAWQYLRAESGAAYLRFDPREDALSELIVLPGWPHMAKKNREDGSYATADLFAQHPHIPGAWKYHSRADSQLTLVTGKKFDPAPLESAIANSALLDNVLIFGNSRPYPGALLFRSFEAQAMSDKELLAAISPMIERTNADNQSHARVPRNMLIPMSFCEGGLEKSSKGTIIRAKAEDRYSETIELAYSSTTVRDGPQIPDLEVSEAILQIVESVVGKRKGLTEQTDLFSWGADSVACVQIRHSVKQLLSPNANDVPLTIVEDCGTIERLTQFVVRRRNGHDQDLDDADSEHQLMLDLAEEYSKFDCSATFDGGESTGDAHCTGDPVAAAKGDFVGQVEPNGEVVVLTGATGALGAHILDLYRRSANVSKIYCLVRGTDDHAAAERVGKALEYRKLGSLDINPSTETSNTKVIVVRARLSEPELGLEARLYNQIVREATIVMHIAWAVNFRVSLRSFAQDHLSGLRNLINLAVCSTRRATTTPPPRFVFCSSVASVSNVDPRATVPESVVDDPSSASPLGYSRSKWVAEQICWRAHQRTRLKGRIAVLRVGQLSGDSQTGIWNEKEAWPMMLSSVRVTGCLPDLEDEALTWLPVDVAARAFVETAETMALMRSSEEGAEMGVYHIVNDDRTVTWTDLLRWLGKLEEFEIVEPGVWVERLERLDREGSSLHPALKLLGLWKSAYGRNNVGREHAADCSHASHVEQMPASSLADEGIVHEQSDEQRVVSSKIQEHCTFEQLEEHSMASPSIRYAMDKTEEAAPVMRTVTPVDEIYFGKMWHWIKEIM